MTLSGTAAATATTDASGNYTFAGLVNGSYTVTPGKTGYTFTPTSSAVTISSVNITGQNFTATAVYSISGTVTSGGSALFGVTMTLSGGAAATTTTDASGNYTFAGLVNGSYTVTPGKTGYTFTPPSKSVTISNASMTGQNFTATAVYSISGTVTSGGSALSGVTMTLSGGAAATTTTDASGNYTFAGLVSGSYTVTPGKTGYTFTPTSSAVTISSANVIAQNFTATAVYSISGTVTSGGSALSGVTMTLSGGAAATTTTDASGNYTFVGLVNGSYTVTPSKTGYTFTPPSKSVTISNANMTAQNFTATAVYSISGTVTSGGSALSGVTMTLSGGAAATATTDASGNYTFAGLVSGSYTVTPGKTGYTFTPTSSAVTISSASVTSQNFTGTLLTFTITPSTGSGGSISPSTPQPVSYNGTISFTVSANAGYHIAGVSVDGVSQGAISSYTFTNVTANHTISASFTRNFGVFGATGVTISGGGYVDSYDSSKGAYSGSHGPNGSIGTNSTANGAINLSGGAVIYGDALVGPGGNPAKAITTSGGAVINGSEGALSSAKSMTPMTDPGGGTSTNFTNGTTLTSGTYRVSSINLSGSGVGTINGNVTLYVTGSMTLSGTAQIVVSQGSSLTLYVDGSVSVSGGGIVNKNLNPHNLTVYGTSTCTTASYSGSSAFYGVIYTPKASTSISGSSGIYGTVIGGSITMSGGAVVHYDESLGNIGG
jgi:inhibitor of cysteine peptidase